MQVLREPTSDGGLWNGQKVADYLSKCAPHADVELWSEDGHRLGLCAMTRRIWFESSTAQTFLGYCRDDHIDNIDYMHEMDG